MILFTICFTSSTKDIPLGLESKSIPDWSLTASSEYNGDWKPIYGRLNAVLTANSKGAWIAKRNDRNQWIQVRVRS